MPSCHFPASGKAGRLRAWGRIHCYGSRPEGGPTTTGRHGPLSADQALHGHKIPPQQQLLLYSADQWEVFVQEWAHYCLKAIYTQVQRFGGAGDRGIDTAGFTDADKLNGVWDNYQCKHYDHALYPTDAFPEISKLLW